MKTTEALRLAIVTHDVAKGDGMGRVNYEIVRYALKRGLKVSILTDRADDEIVRLGAELVLLRVGRLRKINLLKVWEFARKADARLKTLRNEFDIIHGSGYSLGTGHHINTSHFVHSAWVKNPYHTARLNRNLYGLYQWLFSTMNARWEKRAYANANVTVAISRTVRQELQKEVGVPAEKMVTILNGADPEEFHPGKENRAELGLPENVTLGLFAGDLRNTRKNLDTVLKALVQTPELHLAVVGRKTGSPFVAQAEKLGVADRTHFLDYRRDIARIMRASDMFLFPSRYEACALVLMEATASGLPIITAKTTGGSEVVTEESGIILDDPNNVEALSAAMRTLANDPERRREMSVTAHRNSAGYTWEKVVDDYIALYEKQAARTVRTQSTVRGVPQLELGGV